MVLQGHQQLEEVLEWQQEVPFAGAPAEATTAAGGETGIDGGGGRAVRVAAAETEIGGLQGGAGDVSNRTPQWLQLAKDDPQLANPSWQLVRLDEGEGGSGNSIGGADHLSGNHHQQQQQQRPRHKVTRLQSPQCVWMFGTAAEAERKYGQADRPGWRSCMIDVPLPPNTYLMQGYYLFVDQMGPQVAAREDGQGSGGGLAGGGSGMGGLGRDGSGSKVELGNFGPPRVFLYVPRGALTKSKGSRPSLTVLLTGGVPAAEAKRPVLLRDGDVLTVQGARFQLQLVAARPGEGAAS